MKCIIFFLFTLLPVCAEQRHIEVFVCLCDNEHQGIAKVGKAIGNGLDPARNLYWGCSDGLSAFFKSSKKWKLIETQKFSQESESPILLTLKFKHHTGKAHLVAHAYRGDRMAIFLEHYFEKTREAGENQLTAFIGHNGLMDSIVNMPLEAPANDVESETIVLACLTKSYFTAPLKKMNATPLLMTKSLMYPGSFLLHEALEVWLKNGSKHQIREAAAKAYAKNQKISVKAARGIFADLG